MAPVTLIGALEELAKKRAELTSAIVSLAGICGVDPAPYLGTAPAHHRAVPSPDASRGVASKRSTPARPQPPAPPTTNGAGLEDRVLQLLKSGPMSPQAMVDQLKVRREQVFRVLPRLLSAGQVTKTGKMRSTKYALS